MKKRNVFSPDIISTRSGNLVPMRKGFKQYNIGELPGWRDFEHAKRQEFKVTVLKPYKVKFKRDFYSPQKFQIDERFPIIPTRAAKLFPKASQQRNIGRVLSLKEFKCVKTSEKRHIAPEDLFALSSKDNEDNSIELDDNPMTALFSHRSLEREWYRNSVSPKLQNEIGKESSLQKKTLGKVNLEGYSGSQFVTQNEVNLTQSKSTKYNQASFNFKKNSREKKYRSVTPVIENSKLDKESPSKESFVDKVPTTAPSNHHELQDETIHKNPHKNFILNDNNPKLRKTGTTLSPRMPITKSSEEAERDGLNEFHEIILNKTPPPNSLTPENLENYLYSDNESYDRKQPYKKESSIKSKLAIEVKNNHEKLLELKHDIEKNKELEENKINVKFNVTKVNQKEQINLKMLSPQEQRNRPRSSTQNSSDAVFSPKIVVAGDKIFKEQLKAGSSIKSPRYSEMIIRQKTNLYENIEKSPRVSQAIGNKEMIKKTDQAKSGERRKSHKTTTKKSSPIISKNALENQKSNILSDFSSNDQKNDFEGSQASSKRIIRKQETEISLKSSNNESETGKIGPDTILTKKRSTNQTNLDASKSLKPDEPYLEKKKTLMIESKSLNKGLSYKMSIRITGAPDSTNKIEGSQIEGESSFDKSEIESSQNTSYLRAHKSRKPSANSEISSRGSSRSAYLSTSKKKIVADVQKNKYDNANSRAGRSFMTKNTLRNNNLVPFQRLNQDSSLSSDSSCGEDVLDLPDNLKKHSKRSLILKQIEADKKFLKKMQTIGKADTRGSVERQSTNIALKKKSGISSKGLNIFKNFLLTEIKKKARTMDPASNFIYNFSFSILKCMNGLIKLNTFKRLSRRISANKKKLQSIRINHELFERESLVRGKLKVNKKFSVRKESQLKIKIPTIKDQPKIKHQAKSPQTMYSREVALRVMHSPNSPEFKATRKDVEEKKESSSDLNSDSESYSDSDSNSYSSRSSSLANLELPTKFWKKSLIVDLTRQEITFQIAKEMIRQFSIGKSDDKSSISSQSEILDEESDLDYENDIENDIKNLASKLDFSPNNFNFSSKVEFKTPKTKRNLVDFKEVMSGYFEVDYENLLRVAEKNIFCGISTDKQKPESKGLLVSNDEALTDDQMFKNRVKKLRLTLKNHKMKLKRIKEKLDTENQVESISNNEENEKSEYLERFCSEAYSEFEGNEYRETIYKRLKEALEKSTKEKKRIINPNVRIKSKNRLDSLNYLY